MTSITGAGLGPFKWEAGHGTGWTKAVPGSERHMSQMITILLASGAAFFYMSASWIMKAWGGSTYLVLIPAVLVTLSAGAWFETEVLRTSRLGHIIILVLAIEFLMTFLVAVWFLGEQYTIREMTGAAVVIVGIAMLCMTPGHAE